MRTQTRLNRRSRFAAAFWRPVLAWRSLVAQHPAWRFAQIIPIALLLWGLDDVARFRAGAAAAGRHNALVVNSVSSALDGGSTHVINNWTVEHSAAALASSWYYILFQGAITGVVGAVILWRQVPTFSLHRNALVAITLLGLVAFWLYPVAPPRMLPGYHDVIAVTIPAFTSVVETNGAAQFASLPSLHIAWALWAAIALCTVVHKPVLRVLVWMYPFVTAADVLATGNHYLLDIITAPGLLILGYAVALTPALVRNLRRSPVWHGSVRPGSARAAPMRPSLVWPGSMSAGQAWLRQMPSWLHLSSPDDQRRLACTGGASSEHGHSSGQR